MAMAERVLRMFHPEATLIVCGKMIFFNQFGEVLVARESNGYSQTP
jgi:hypothetical protein